MAHRPDAEPTASDPFVFALQDPRRRLLQVQRAIGMGLWDLDVRAQQVLVSEESYRICGLEPKPGPEPLERFLSAVHPDDLPAVEARLAAAIRGEREYDIDVRVLPPDGIVRWVNTAADVTRDADGHALKLVGTLLDITHRKQVEAVLRASEQRLRLLHALNDAVDGVSDPEQILPTALKVLGEHMGLSRCAFGYMDSDGEGVSVPHDYTHGCDSVAGRYRLSMFGRTACNTLQSGRPFVANDIAKALPRQETATFDAIHARAVICCALIRRMGAKLF